MALARFAAGWSAVALIAVPQSGCGSVTVRHAPEPPSLSSSEIPDLRGAPAFDVRGADASAAEVEIGTVGVGRVVGTLQEWTRATVVFVKAEVSKRGATVSPDAPKALTLAVSKAQVRAIPIVGGATSTVSIAVQTADGQRAEFEGSASSLAPLRAMNAATAEAVKAMFADGKVVAYLKQ